MTEVDVRGDAVLGRPPREVGEDLVAVGDRVVAGPRLELVAERVQVRVRADAWVAEQVPGPADRVARLEDRERLVAAGGA